MYVLSVSKRASKAEIDVYDLGVIGDSFAKLVTITQEAIAKAI